MKTTLPSKNSMHRASLRGAFLLIPLVLACFGLAPMAQAVGPDTDGSIPGANNGEGTGVLVSRTGGIWNTGTGFEALNHLTGGNQNTATGLRALFSDINGGFNTATGVYSLFSNTSGFFNSATGAYSLANNTDGNYNTANGYGALYYNTGGDQNTAVGYGALYVNTATGNTATGYRALYYSTEGDFNTANGYLALANNTIGAQNTAVGVQALYDNRTGVGNTAVGYQALAENTQPFKDGISGFDNTAIGYQALQNNGGIMFPGIQNTAVGSRALQNNQFGNFNIAIGYLAGSAVAQSGTESGNIDIGNVGVAGDNGTIRIGSEDQTRTFIAGIRGVTTGNMDAINVMIDSNGQLGTVSSAVRFKKEIRPMEKTSEAILALKPVTFHYKSDSTGTPQFGLIAEEVAAVNPDLVVRDKNGEIYTVRYDAVNAMLLNEFLKEHRKVEELKSAQEKQQAMIAQQQKDFQITTMEQRKDFESKIAQQHKQIEALTASLKEQAAQIQKVSAEIEVSKFATGRIRRGGPAPRTVLNK